ncbi:MAG: hypothetical protein R8M38_07845 [Mariprofundaceae bacterium]
MLKKIVMITIFTLALTGCSLNKAQVPQPETYHVSHQQKMQAGHHWRILAEQEAKGIAAGIAKDATLFVQIEVENSDSPFRRAYENLLISSLVELGVIVMSNNEEASVKITSHVQVLRHQNRGYLAPPSGSYTALASGIYMFYHVARHWTHPALAAIPIVFGADLFSGSSASKSPVEVLITTRGVTSQHVIKVSHSSIYYLNVGDEANYLDEKLPVGTTFKVVNRR